MIFDMSHIIYNVYYIIQNTIVRMHSEVISLFPTRLSTILKNTKLIALKDRTYNEVVRYCGKSRPG